MRFLHRLPSRYLLFPLFFFLAIPMGQAQEGDWCGTDERRAERMEGVGETRWHAAFEKALQKGSQRSSTDTIPIVVHVIHEGDEGNISYEQIKDGVRVMNEDFNRKNPDSSATRSVFDSLAANSNIVFRLARYGPSGNCTNGVTRTRSKLTNNADDRVKDLVRWPTDEYMNFWVANSLDNGGNNTLLGYAQFPYGGINENYGIVMRNDRFGTIGTSNSNGRTATHEVGHCLGLYHTFQDGCGSNCQNSGDRICDTPPVKEETFGCDLNQNSCSNDTMGPSPYSQDVRDQIENYMSYDACQNMFSKGQKAVMKGVLSTINGLENLTSTKNLKRTGVHENPLCKADFSSSKEIVCAGKKVHFQDRSYHGIKKRTWIFPGASPFFSLNKKNPSVSYSEPGLYDVELTVEQGQDELKVRKKDHIRVLDSIGKSTPYQEIMEKNPVQSGKIIPRESFNGLEWVHTKRTGASGSASLLFENYYAEKGWSYSFETRSIDASSESSVGLSFKVAYRRKNPGDQDVLKVYASNNCGTSWSQRGSFSANEMETGEPKGGYYKKPKNWKSFKIEQPLDFGYNVEGLRFRFVFETDGGNNIYIDDINVAGQDVLSLDEKSGSEDLNLYPNPTSERVHFQIKGAKNYRYRLKDASGRTLRKGETDGEKGTISVGSLSNGFYFLHFERDGKADEVRKLIVR